jgi:hypothetical protein
MCCRGPLFSVPGAQTGSPFHPAGSGSVWGACGREWQAARHRPRAGPPGPAARLEDSRDTSHGACRTWGA